MRRAFELGYPPDRHRRDVRRRRRRSRSSGRRWPRPSPAGDRAARRGVHRHQGLPAQRQRAAASPRPATAAGRACGSMPSTSTCCTGAAAIHWARRSPASKRCRDAGRIRALGRVATSTSTTCSELWRLPAGTSCAVNQVYYSASQRGIEFDLLPWQRERIGGRRWPIARSTRAPLPPISDLARIARRLGLTAAQVALAWVLRHPDVIAIPKAVREDHLRENLAAAQSSSPPPICEAIDRPFAPPRTQAASRDDLTAGRCKASASLPSTSTDCIGSHPLCC